MKIRIKNFGPIKQGFTDTSDGFFEIKRITLLIGEQASGKSCIAKLISSFLWLEKCLLRQDMRNELSIEDVHSKNFFVKLFDYHYMTEYFSEKTEIEYYGQVYKFTINGKNIFCEKYADINYAMPKIMYVPAERNLISVFENPFLVDNFPPSLYTLLDEYHNACLSLGNSKIKLPIADAYFSFDRTTQLAYIADEKENYIIPLYKVASGIHSIVPMSIVSEYLTNQVSKPNEDTTKRLNINYTNKVNEKYTSILDKLGLGSVALGIFLASPFVLPAGMITLLTSAGIKFLDNQDAKKKFTESDISEIKKSFTGFYNSFFYNIVEEPEQNLFPTAQKSIVFRLLECLNEIDKNQLLITTHSPYILAYLNIAIKANSVAVKSIDKKESINEIISENVWIDGNDVAVYQLNNGKIKKLKKHDGVFISDDNMLNAELENSNELYSKLLETEYSYDGQ